MKRVLIWFLGAATILSITAVGYIVYEFGLISQPPVVMAAPALVEPQAPMAAPALEGPQVQTADGVIVADARVVPVLSANLSLQTGGVTEAILVKEGQKVKAGDVLVRLDAARQRVAVAQAQAQVQRAQANLQQILAGPRLEEVATAKASLDAAQARYDRLINASMPGQIKQAEAGVALSSAQLAQVLEGADENALIAARAENAAAAAQLTQAQRAYDQVKWRNDIGALPESAALQTASINYEAAKARMAQLEKGATAATVSVASAGVRQAQVQLETLKATMPSDISVAETDVAIQQAQYDLVLAGARPESVAIAQADVAAATAALQEALVALSQTELRAPFAGTVARITLNVGEQVGAGAPVVTMADLTKWQIETEDLTELDVVVVKPGSTVMVGFDAIPDLQMKGKVLYVRPVGEDNRGDIVYTVVVEPERNDDRLLWNMTAVVTINGAQ